MFVLGIILIIYFGFRLVKFICPSLNLLESLGLSFPVGVGVYTLLIYLLSLLSVKINLFNASAILVVLVLAFGMLTRLTKIKRERYNEANVYTQFEKIITIIICFLAMSAFVIALYWPINVWDALVLYDFRAKVILETGYFYQIHKNFEYFSLYPLLTSIIHACIYLWGGNNPQIVYPLFLFSFVTFFYGVLRRYALKTTSLFVSLLLISTPMYFEHSTIAYTNLLYAIYITSGIILIHQFFKQRNFGYILLSAVLFGLSTWTRFFEQFWLIGALTVLFYAIRSKNLKPIFLFGIPFIFIALPWWWFQLKSGGINSTADAVSFSGIEPRTLFDIGRLLTVIKFIFKYVLTSWGMLPLFVIFVIFLEFKTILKDGNTFLLLAFLLGIGILLAGTYLFTFAYSTWMEIPDSAIRMSMFFIPLFLFFIGSSKTLKSYTKQLSKLYPKFF